jgi:hypothetical protein
MWWWVGGAFALGVLLGARQVVRHPKTIEELAAERARREKKRPLD